MSELHFAQIREDGRLELKVLESTRARRVVCIGSGGCIALSLLRDEVETVWAVDASPGQCALIELKRAALREFSRKELLSFLGEGRPSGVDRSAMLDALLPGLPTWAQDFWSRHRMLLSEGEGANHCGTTERFYRHVGRQLLAVQRESVWEGLLQADSIEAQREIYARSFETPAWRRAVAEALSRTAHLRFFPAFMFAQAQENDFAAFFASQFEREIQSRLLRGNFFLTQLLWGTYAWGERDGAPDWLSEEGWARARRNADRLVVVPSPLEHFLPAVQGIDAFFLSNVFDWAQPAQARTLGEAVVHAAAPGAALLFRNMLSIPPLPDALSQRLQADPVQSGELHALERSMLYRRVYLGRLS